MATKPLPPDSENLTVNVPKGFKKRLRAQAERSGVNLSEYVRETLRHAVDGGALIKVSKEVSYQFINPDEEFRQVAEDQSSYTRGSTSPETATDEVLRDEASRRRDQSSRTKKSS